MEAGDSASLDGTEIHGFQTKADLRIEKLMEDASARWLRPNEVHAILSNYTLFKIQPQPTENPRSITLALLPSKDCGTILLFDRKMLRNFRKDGHNWKKKKDGKTVQEAHEKLKIGNEERIHVYYARSEDDPNFYRRCYWLLDKKLERIVLVHYRQTSEENASQNPSTPVECTEALSLTNRMHHGSPSTPINSSGSAHSELSGSAVMSEEINSREDHAINTGSGISLADNCNELWNHELSLHEINTLDWEDLVEPQTSTVSMLGVASSSVQQMPDGFRNSVNNVLVVGHFNEPYKHLMTSNIYCVFGEMHAAAEMIQAGVYHCTAMPHPPGSVNFFMTLDGYTPISQVLSFDYRSAPSVKLNGGVTSSEDDNNNLKWKEFQVQARLAHLLFSTTDNISIQSNRIQSKSLKEAKRYLSATSPLMAKDWMNLLRLSSNSEALHVPATQDLFELVLKNKLQEWILEKVAEGCKTTSLDSQGQGVIHLCAILDYAWAARLFALSGMSLDFRDASGWTALHWAAYFGREKMVAALLSVGANPSLVTDPTSEFPGGCTAADLASNQGYEGLAAYLAEKGLTAHFQAMSLSGNISVPLSPSSTNQVSSENVYAENLTEQELCLKESLAAYRNAADAADRIQAAFRERALKQQTKAVQLDKPEIEAVQIVAALKIQHAFRNHSRRRMLKAAARIQSHFRTWKIRRHFLNMRKQAIKIQAVFRGHQVRKQYCKIIWSVGVLEKAILRWRLKRKGLRGIQVESKEAMKVDTEEESTEEDFFRISREQAEERVKRSVIRVQAMFRSHRAQQEYRRMKLAHEQANVVLLKGDILNYF
ncbi:calmodulin-binding transcription activator CBT isoform X7 [Phoenix dactylifera]|uniref:Calmodulin-binding transcription activator CBT isoform X7 n=1 Tax=Phoenix dactylifera TaxID=42345 RepID=A0A8B8ZQN9_PHODC|nr:calmodulin-binding transcription activator CBT isoform X7 [Phoenix dactylifera]